MKPSRASELGFLIIPRIMLALIVLVGAMHCLMYQIFPNVEEYHWTRDQFDLGAEGNVPTWVASVFWLVIVVSAGLCYRISRGKSGWRRWPWLVIAAIFTVASIDEVAEIHEAVGHYLQKPQIATGNPNVLIEGSPGSPWILYYAPFLAAAIIGMVAFLYMNLRRRFFALVCAGFVCFITAIGMDYFQGMYDPYRDEIAAKLHVDKMELVGFSVFAEELIELLGMTLISWAFLGQYEYEKRSSCKSSAGACADRLPPTEPVEQHQPS